MCRRRARYRHYDTSGSRYPTAPLEKNEQTTRTKIKPPYSDGRVELNGGADRIRDAQISWNTLFQDVPSGLGRFLSPPNVFSSVQRSRSIDGPTAGPVTFRLTTTPRRDPNCTKLHFLVHSIRPATLFRESATCSISDEKIHRRVPIFSCSFSTFSRRKRPGSLKFAIVLAVIMSFAHVKEGVRFHFSLKNFFFRLSRWWTPNRRVPGRIECTNRAQIPLRTPQNRLGAVSQQSGRVGKHLYAFSKAQIALDNIPTVLGRVCGV